MNGSPNGSSKMKSIIVTGGASGLGLAMTSHFASQGHTVTILDIDGSSGPAIAEDIGQRHPEAVIRFRKCDVSSWQDQAAAFKAVYEDIGTIDIVMANAGISEQGASCFAEGDEGDAPVEPRLKTLDVNLMGVIYSVKLAVHYMRKNDRDISATESGTRGSIICTASNAGLYAFPIAPLYAASKFGIIGLVRSLSRLLERQAIQINALAPAVLETNIAPSKALFENMIITPISTLIRGVIQFLEDPSITGSVAEIHGESVTLRPQHDFVDEDSRANVENFWKLGYA